MNEEITTQVIGIMEAEGFQDHARRIHGVEGVAPTQNAHSGGGLETKIAVPIENTDGKKMSIISRPHGYYKMSEYDDICPCVKSSAMADNNYVKEMTASGDGVESKILEPNVLAPKRTEYGKAVRKAFESGQLKESRHNMNTMVPKTDGTSNTLTSAQKDNYLAEPINPMPDGNYRTIKAQYAKTSSCQFSRGGTFGATGATANYRIRKLTPRECFRLMGCDEPTIDKLLNAGISNTQLYKLAGNSIVIDVLYHIIRKMIVDKQCEEKQLSLF